MVVNCQFLTTVRLSLLQTAPCTCTCLIVVVKNQLVIEDWLSHRHAMVCQLTFGKAVKSRCVGVDVDFTGDWTRLPRIGAPWSLVLKTSGCFHLTSQADSSGDHYNSSSPILIVFPIPIPIPPSAVCWTSIPFIFLLRHPSYCFRLTDILSLRLRLRHYHIFDITFRRPVLINVGWFPSESLKHASTPGQSLPFHQP